MERIPWETYNPHDFQTFCNALLSFEVSKNYIGYNAPGKDTGYDGQYDGEYNGIKGLWRFQCKFHKTARKQAFNSIKSDLDKELHKVGAENNLIILTNVEILPQERKELIEKAATYLLENGKQKVFFDIWDGTKLLNISLRYPIVRLWLEDKFSTAQLQPFQKDKFEAFGEINYFAGRRQQIEEIKEFISSESPLVLISGEAGIGKTRLCLEYFNELKNDENWRILVLNAHAIDFDKINLALSGEKNFIVFIDDAHQYSAEIIADFYRIASIERVNKVKIVLTARSIFYYESLKLIKEFEQLKIPQIQLKKLEVEETKQVFENSLSSHFLGNYITDLVIISRGRPILISAIINAAKKGVHLTEIKKDSFLRDYVTNYFDSFIDVVIRETGEQKLKYKNLLWLLCLIEPINYNDKKIIPAIATNETLSIEAIEIFIEKLKEYGFIVGRFEMSIKPDYYSDIYLSSATDGWIQRKIDKYGEFTNNIIKNLVAIEEVEAEGNTGVTLIDTILNNFTGKIENATSIEQLNDIFKTIDYIAYQKPNKAVTAIEKFIAIASNTTHPLYTRLHNDFNRDSTTQYGYLYEIKSILYDVAYQEEFYPSVIDLVTRLYKLTKNKTLFNSIIGFSRRDAIERYKTSLQNFYVDYISHFLKDENSELIEFIVSSFKDLLRLSFTTSASTFPDRYKITITTYNIKETSTIKELRMKIINSLSTFFINSLNTTNKHLALDLLLDIPREISAAKRDKSSYEGKNEIKKIISFLIDITKAGVELGFQQKILERIYWYRKWEVSDDVIDGITIIEANLTPQSLPEKLIKLFTRTSEDIDLDFKELEDKFKREATTIIENSSAEELYSTLIEIIESHSQLPSYFTPFIHLILNYSEKAMRIFEIAFSENKKFIIEWGCVFLRVLYLRHGESKFYWNYVNQIYSWDSIEGYNCILYIYNYRTDESEKTKLTTRDAELLISIYEKKLPETFHHLAYSLPCLLNVDKQKATQILGEFLDICTQTNADNLLFFLLHYYLDCMDEIKTLIFEHTYNHAITYYIENALQTILNKEWDTNGFKDVFNYFLKRHEKFIGLIRAGDHYPRYDFVPIGDRTSLLQDRTQEEKDIIFKNALIWFISESKEYKEMYFNKALIEYLQSSNYITDSLKKIYNDLISENEGNSNHIYMLCSSLEMFHDKNEKLLEIIVRILLLNEMKFKSEEDMYSDIRSACYSAITTLGGKSGTAGQPFQVDLDQQQFLIEQLEAYKANPNVTELLKNALRYVERDINDDFRSENDEW